MTDCGPISHARGVENEGARLVAEAAEQEPMKWGRGFFRLWLAGSAIWFAYIASKFDFVGIIDELLHPPPPPALPPAATEVFGLIALFGFGLPLAVLVLGLMAAWIARGFRPRRDEQ
jgi:hypothetical protein